MRNVRYLLARPEHGYRGTAASFWVLVAMTVLATGRSLVHIFANDGGANMKLGQHLVLPKDTPLCNVWLTMLQGLGIDAPRHGDSTGVVKELQG